VKRDKENPPHNRTIHQPPLTRFEAMQYVKCGGMDREAFYWNFPDARPDCLGVVGCACPSCCKMRGRERGRER